MRQGRPTALATVLGWWARWWRSPAGAARHAARAPGPAGLPTLVVANACAAGGLAAAWGDPQGGVPAVLLGALGAAVLVPAALAAGAVLLHAAAVAVGGRGSPTVLVRALAPASVLWPLAVLCRMVPGGRPAAALLGLAVVVAAVQATAAAERLALRPAWLAVGLAVAAAAAIGVAGRLLF